MMDLEKLQEIATLKYQQSQQALSEILKRETELRNELEQMQKLVRKTQAQDPEDAQLRSIGADIIWLKWVGKVQRELNVSLAGVLARKEALMGKHRRETGRKIAAEAVAEKQKTDRPNKKSKTQLESVISDSLQYFRD